ncbi:MAG TPA: heparan-alpha-glucosaminide N-acetyltransferase domain-containing protein [Vicinamibacterales bacterium]
MSRRGYLDWLRGVAVLIMIEAHTLDAWTRMEERNTVYGWAMVLGGFGAPIFLFLAGVALALAAGTRLRRDRSPSEAAALARKRGWQILGLAFLFRLQSWVISGGDVERALLKVDILNIMGVAMLAGALLWGLGRGRWSRALMLAAATVGAAMVTPIVRATPLLDFVPDPIEWYLRPSPGRTTFTLFPWAGFLLAGGAVGMWLDAARMDRDERRIMLALAALGPAVAVGAYAASFLPPIYEQTSFWTSSPTFFFLRLGILISLLPIAYAWNALVPGRSPLREFGVASLFVYWIHVEMLYGVVSTPLHRQLTLGQAVVAFAVFSLFLYGLVKLKDYLVARRKRYPHPVTT